MPRWTKVKTKTLMILGSQTKQSPTYPAMQITGEVPKGVDTTDATLTQGWNNGFFTCGSGNGASGDQHSVTLTDFYIPMQVNMVSIANPSAPSHFTAAMLRTDVTTADQVNTLCNPLAIRSDIQMNVYGIEGINVDMGITKDITVATGVNGGYFQITGDGAITNTAENHVLCADYRGTNGSSGIDYVGSFRCNAPDCAVTSILSVRQVQGTVASAIKFRGTCGVAFDFTGATTMAADLTSAPAGTLAGQILITDVGGTTAYINYYSSSAT